jgi:diamine N-acetyltransferase
MASKSPQIRAATGGDLDAVCALYAQGDALHRAKIPFVFREHDGPARSPAYLQSLLQRADIAVWVAERDGQVVGMLVAIERHVPDLPFLMPRHYVEVDAIVVDEGCRGQGIGGGLLATAESWAALLGCDGVQLGVWEFNERARAFYEKHGYATAMRRMWKDLCPSPTYSDDEA